jgi:hypothetical protein
LLRPVRDRGYWRLVPLNGAPYAGETRRIADQLDDPVAKQKMLEAAQHYGQIAAIAERHPVSSKP